MKYRIVRDSYLGYEAQYKHWWWPAWLPCFCVNTCATIERARTVCDRHAGEVVEYYKPSEQPTKEDGK